MKNPRILLEQFSELRAASLAGCLSQEDFDKAIRELRVQDDQGTWWTVDVSGGGLLYYDQAKKTWYPAGVPPADSPPPADRPFFSGRSPVNGVLKSAVKGTTASSNPLGTVFHAIVGGLVVFFFSAGLSVNGWDLLGLVPQVTSALVPQGTCLDLTAGSVEMFLCSALAAFLALLGSGVTLLVLFLLRRQLTACVGRLIQPLPAFLRSIVFSIFAALFFTMVWAGAHYNTGDARGILIQNRFPAVVGLFTYITAIGHRQLQHALARLFAWRGRRSKLHCYAASIGIPLLLELLLAGVSPPALKEQVVVMVSLVIGYLSFTPERGLSSILAKSRETNNSA